MDSETKRKKTIFYCVTIGLRIIGRKFYESGADFLMIRDLNREETPWKNAPKLQWREADISDLPALKECRPRLKLRPFKKRLLRNEHCLIGVKKGKIIYYCWLTWADSYYLDDINFTLSLAPDKAYLYDAYTNSAYRNRGIYQAALRESSRRMLQKGKKLLLLLVNIQNSAAIRPTERVGFNRVGLMHHRKILWSKHSRFTPLTKGSIQ